MIVLELIRGPVVGDARDGGHTRCSAQVTRSHVTNLPE